MSATQPPPVAPAGGPSFGSRSGWNRLDSFPYDPVSSEHLWVLSTLYRIRMEPGEVPAQDPAGGKLLDQENLVMVTPVFCYHCELPYTPQRGEDPCEGDPDER